YIEVSEDNVSLRVYLSQGGTCTYCHGEGEYVCRTCNGTGRFANFGYYSACFSCGGNGKIRCSVCDGSGYKE
ncbi:MAG: hypothetical protein LUD48_06360, partial [Prevotella sp.]|nr:hypothetical protein [Prevotella sp.]